MSDEYGISAYRLLKERGDFEFDRRTYAKLYDFILLLESMRTEAESKSVVEVIELVLDKTKYMESLLSSKNEEDFQRAKNIEQLISAAAMFEEENEDKSLQNFLNSITLSFEEDDGQKEDKVMLMTVHAAKGLEFEVVFLTGLEEGLFPLLRSEGEIELQNELEEERRLCYVAITRAKRFLVLTYANNRRVFGRFSSRQKSSFIDEIPIKYIQQIYTPLSITKSSGAQSISNTEDGIKKALAVGDIIQHKKFGIGKVLSVSEDMNEVLIDFEKFGQKRLLLSYANLIKIG